jgi:hypothetical protein
MKNVVFENSLLSSKPIDGEIKVLSEDIKDENLILLGTHGTSKSRAEKIIASQKFDSSLEGYAGPGIYFWAYEKDVSYAKEVAQLWWQFVLDKQKTYEKDKDKSCSILNAKINVLNKEEYLDIATQYYKEQILSVLRAQNCTEKSEVGRIIASIVEKHEISLSTKISILKAAVTTPPPTNKNKSIIQIVYTMSDCYIIRHERNNLLSEIIRLQ